MTAQGCAQHFPFFMILLATLILCSYHKSFSSFGCYRVRDGSPSHICFGKHFLTQTRMLWLVQDLKSQRILHLRETEQTESAKLLNNDLSSHFKHIVMVHLLASCCLSCFQTCTELSSSSVFSTDDVHVTTQMSEWDSVAFLVFCTGHVVCSKGFFQILWENCCSSWKRGWLKAKF